MQDGKTPAFPTRDIDGHGLSAFAHPTICSTQGAFHAPGVSLIRGNNGAQSAPYANHLA